jgi:hypothetical protein
MSDFLEINDIQGLEPNDAREFLESVIQQHEHLASQLIVHRDITELAINGASDEIVESYGHQTRSFEIELEWVKRQIAAARTILETL